MSVTRRTARATRTRVATAVVAATTAYGLVSAPAATAAQQRHHWNRTLTTNVAAPFQIALSRGHVYFTDGLAGTFSRITRSGDQVVASAPGGEIAGAELSPDGRTMAFTTLDYATGAATLTIRRAGRADVVADLGGYEAAQNPDGAQTYGLVAGGNPCAEQVLSELTGGPATYTGMVDSHPYAVSSLPGGAWAVADAGGNDILRVSATGQVSTLSVLPPQPITLTADQVHALGAPDCLIGVTYAFEPVPTDVERDAHGRLFVSTLPGGPEDASLGARGSVYRVWQGGSQRVVTGFLGAADLAVAPSGTIFVAELFNGRIARYADGRITTAVRYGSPVSVEVHGDFLYIGMMGTIDVTTGEVLSPGKVSRVRI